MLTAPVLITVTVLYLGLLMSFGFLGLLMEFYTPGFGIIGGIGLTCLALFFFGHAVVHLAGLEELLLFGVGLVLLGIELFVTPGFGVLGVLGLAGIAASLVMALVALPLDVSIDTGELAIAAFRVLGSVARSPAGVRCLSSRPPLRGPRNGISHRSASRTTAATASEGNRLAARAASSRR